MKLVKIVKKSDAVQKVDADEPEKAIDKVDKFIWESNEMKALNTAIKGNPALLSKFNDFINAWTRFAMAAKTKK